MMDQEWWQRTIQRPRPVQPQRLPPLNPTGARMPIMPNTSRHMPDILLGGLRQLDEYPPNEIMRQSGVVDEPAGLPIPPQVEAPSEEMPPRISEQDLDYAQLTSPPKKEKLWKDILYVAGQAAANIFDTEGNEQPIERLGETQKRRKDAQAMQRIGVRNARQKAEQDAALRSEQIKNYQNTRINQERDDKFRAEKDARDYELKVKTFDFKVEDRAEYYRLEQVKADAKARNDQRMYDLAVRKQEEIERNNKAKIDATNENVDRRINANPKNNPAPPRSGSPKGKGKDSKDPLNLFSNDR